MDFARRLALGLLFLTACGGDDPPADTSCVRDAEQIAARSACVTDEHCPCGTHCTLGECVASCLDASECGDDERCDAFGYCRDADDLSRIPEFAPAEVGELMVGARRIEMFDEAMPRAVRLTALGLGIGEMRALAEEGLEVSCDGGSEYAMECRFDSLEVDATVDLFVRATEPLDDTEIRVVRVFAERQRELISVTSPANVLGSMSALVTTDALTAIGGPLAGSYEGRARRVRATVGDEMADLGPRFARAETYEVTGEIHAAADTGAATLVLNDESTLIGGVDSWIGALEVMADGSGTLDFPSTLFHTADASFGEPIEVVLDPDQAQVTVQTTGARSVSFSVVTHQRGVLDGQTIQSEWVVTLFRVDELPAGATEPSVPADVVASLDATRGNDATAWEASIGDSLRDLIADPDLFEGQGNTVFPAFYREGANLIACSLSGDESGIYQSVWVSAFDEDFVYDSSFDTINSSVRLTNENILEYVASADANPLIRLLAKDLVELPDFIGPPIAGLDINYSVFAEVPDVDHEVPCAFSLDDEDVLYFGSGVCGPREPVEFFDYDPANAVDVCAQMQERFDCELVDSAPGDTEPLTFAVRSEDSDFGCGIEVSETLNLDVTRRCVFPTDRRHLVARDCGELASCFSPTSMPPEANGLIGGSARLGTELENTSGDLRCESSVGGSTMGAMIAADLNEADLATPAMLRACIEEIDRLRSEDPSAATLGSAFEASECVDVVRLYYALSESLERTRVRMENDLVAPDAREERLAGRLLQRWIQLHTFIARGSSQAERLAQVIRSVAPDDESLPPPVEDTLAASLQGWDLLLHPRFSNALLAIDPMNLAIADYRPQVGMFDDPSSGREHGDGVAVAIVDGLVAQLGLVHILIERAQQVGDRDALADAHEVARRVHMVRPIADAIFARAAEWARSEDTALPWKTRYESASLQLDNTLASLSTEMQALREGRNPFGVEDQDLPLYFSADTVGAGGRFSAISDFLLGESLSSANNFAPTAVRLAGESLESAREAWTAYTDRRTARAQSAAELDARLEEINLRFGGDVTSYCGAPSGLTTVNVLSDWDTAHGSPFNPDNCYYNRDEPGCTFDLGRWVDLISQDDLLYQYCVADELTKRMGDIAALGIASTRAVLADFAACADDAEWPMPCEDSPDKFCFRCNDETVEVEPAPSVLQGLHAGAPGGVLTAARSACAMRFPRANPQLPGIDQAGAPGLENSRCYRGSLGEAALTARAVAQDAEIARSEFAEFQERYDLAMNSCLILQLGNEQLEGATAMHNQTMTELRAGKLAADIIANQAGGTKDCTANLGSSVPPASIAACAAGAVESAASSVSDGLQFAMDEAQAQHEALLASIAGDIAEEQCFNDAELELVGVRTAGLRIQRASSDLQLALYQMAQLQINAETAYTDGRASLQAAEDRSVSPMAHDYWLDERLETYVRRMRNAKRIVYLTVRAVEYEYQQSLDARGAALAAELPDELEAVLDSLWTTAGTRRVNGASPADLKVVVSLKRNVLQLGDTSMTAMAGGAGLSDTDLLRRLLLDPRYEVWEDGDFLGRAIPFDLVPLGFAGDSGVSVFAQNSCAERVWSVNATVLGDEESLYIGDDPSFIDIQLLKSNTFFSQWCSDGMGSDYQEASVRPSRNLFADPGSGSSVGDELGLGNETNLFTRARMQAFFNVDRETFSEDSFANGDSTELAGRGLYGEYSIFFPAGVLSDRGGPGLNLNAIDDILLRLDYVSVAR